MGELTTIQRDRLRDSDFACIDRAGERHLPINDADHVRIGVARFGQTEFESAQAKYAAAKRILAAARRHDIEVARDSEVANDARSYDAATVTIVRMTTCPSAPHTMEPVRHVSQP